jgi:hypothetical protein
MDYLKKRSLFKIEMIETELPFFCRVKLLFSAAAGTLGSRNQV